MKNEEGNNNNNNNNQEPVYAQGSPPLTGKNTNAAARIEEKGGAVPQVRGTWSVGLA